MNIQVIATYAIVVVCAYFVALRIWDQLAALRSKPGKNGATVCDTCGGCAPPKRAEEKLIGLSVAPVRRPRIDPDSLPPHLRELAGKASDGDNAHRN